MRLRRIHGPVGGSVDGPERVSAEAILGLMAAFRLNRVHRAISELTPRGRRGAGERLVRGLRDVLLSPELLPGMDAGDPAPPAQPAAALAMGVA